MLGSSSSILLNAVLQNARPCLPVPFYCSVSYASNLIRLWQIRYAEYCSASRIINFMMCFWNNSYTVFSSIFIDCKILKPEDKWQFILTTCLSRLTRLSWPTISVCNQQTCIWDPVPLISLLHVLRACCKISSSIQVQMEAFLSCQQTLGLSGFERIQIFPDWWLFPPPVLISTIVLTKVLLQLFSGLLTNKLLSKPSSHEMIIRLITILCFSLGWRLEEAEAVVQLPFTYCH